MDVRILPMDRIEHCDKSIELIQEDFFLKDLPTRYDGDGLGKYCYKEKGIVAEENTPILFQYKNKIIAMALFEKKISFKKEQNGYHGAYYFKPETIEVFNPISEDSICSIFNKSIKFSNVKYKLNKDFLSNFISSLENIRGINRDIIKSKEWECIKTACIKEDATE